jgi:hypothetical protein
MTILGWLTLSLYTFVTVMLNVLLFRNAKFFNPQISKIGLYAAVGFLLLLINTPYVYVAISMLSTAVKSRRLLL